MIDNIMGPVVMVLKLPVKEMHEVQLRLRNNEMGDNELSSINEMGGAPRVRNAEYFHRSTRQWFEMLPYN